MPIQPVDPAHRPAFGLILAGGEGRRMGGQDKGWVVCGGQPLVLQVRDRIAPQVGEVWVSANRNIAQYSALPAKVVKDRREGFWGPLAGVEAALEAMSAECDRAASDRVLVTACDLPNLPRDAAARLLSVLQKSERRAAVALANGQRHAVFLMQVSDRPVVSRLLDEGNRRLRRLWDALEAIDVSFDDCASSLANVNQPADLA